MKLENFKAFGSVDTIKLAPITLIYGPNSGGKSSIIQSLILLKQSFSDKTLQTTKLIPRGDFVDLGTFKSIIHGHNTKAKLRIGVKYSRDLPNPERMNAILPNDADRSVEMIFQSARERGSGRQTSSQLDTITYGLQSSESTIGFDIKLGRALKPPRSVKSGQTNGSEADIFSWSSVQSAENFLKFAIERRRLNASKFLQTRLGLGNIENAPLYSRALEKVSSSFIVGDGQLPRTIVSEDGEGIRYSTAGGLIGPSSGTLDYLSREFVGILTSISYLGPLRSHPARHYVRQGGTIQTVGTQGENTPQVIASQEKQIKSRINNWFERFGIPYKLTPRHFGNETSGEIVSINLTDVRTKLEFSPSDVGFGIGQLLPIIVEGLVSQQRTICVEQPEIHLHPRLQGHLADYFVDTTIGEGAEKISKKGYGNQWIVETHSEALMLRLQRRIREGKLSPDAVSVIYVNPVQKSMGSEILHLRLDNDGEFIDEWPDGFFEETYREIFPRIPTEATTEKLTQID
ncbi:DUF3696 domain-containing protein [Methylobacterium sp. Leaf94]|uniref:DUF3696 domain-containing protein n=1 Tax=Methylobacterium sp. Leaf94 TaxID=1736250 RepID=UPI00190FC977|nr:DUF3696 domain-containing protein [Methylobacterium sp. Leaf94]